MTTEQRIEMLDTQLERLKYRTRVNNWVMVVMMFFIVWQIVTINTSLSRKPRSLNVNSITCQYFNIEDENGNRRALIGTHDDETFLMFNGKKNDASTWLRMDKNGDSSLSLRNGDANIILGLDYRGAALNLTDFVKDHKASVSLAAQQDGATVLNLFTMGKGISTKAWLADSKDGSAEMGMMNAQGQTRASLGATKGEGPVMAIRDGAGKTKWSTP